MNNAKTIALQVLLMFILTFIGYLMYRNKKITNEGSKTIGNILIYLSLPCVIIKSFLVEYTPEKLKELIISAALALAILLAAMLISRLVLGRSAIDNFGGSFSNPGFFGVPVITATLAGGAVFYVAPFIAFLNLLQWTYGVGLLKNSDENGQLVKRSGSGESFGAAAARIGKSLIKAPFMIAILAGLFFFLTGIKLPEILTNGIGHIAGLNTALAMFSIGVYLAQTDFLAIFRKPRLYLVALVRMVLAPAAAMALLCLVPGEMLSMKLALLIAAACPVGSNVAVYAQLHGKDYGYAVETVILSTLLSIVTMPLIIMAAGMIW